MKTSTSFQNFRLSSTKPPNLPLPPHRSFNTKSKSSVTFISESEDSQIPNKGKFFPGRTKKETLCSRHSLRDFDHWVL
ncbi:hypothetical protein GQ457_04G015920 [Hibiscus cannabinus]